MNKTCPQPQEYRCKCNALLFKGVLIDSEVEVKCKRCGSLTRFKGEPSGQYICLVKTCAKRVQ